MKVQLNVGLNITGRRNSLKDCTDRARAALDLIRTAGLRYRAERCASEYEGPNGIALEDTLVIEIDAPAVGGGRTVSALAYDIAVKIDQDCVAVWWPGIQRGSLVGPNAAEWGEFNPSFFHTIEEVALPRAA